MMLDAAQERRLKAIERRFRKCFADLEALAIEAGADPATVVLYFEGEGGLHALSRFEGGNDGRSSPDDIICSISWLGAANSIDCGAW